MKNIFVLLLTFATIVVLWSKIFFWGDGGVYGRTYPVWGDWSLHVSIASLLAYRPVVLWQNQHPLFLGEKFSYPFLSDGISGILLKLGFDLVSAMILPMIVVSIALFLVLYMFYKNALGGRGSYLLFLTIFLCSGGLGFLANYLQGGQLFQYGLLGSRGSYTGGMSNQFFYAPVFGNIVYYQFIPQRGMLFGLLVSSFVLYKLVGYLESQNFCSKKIVTRLLFLGLLSGCLTVIHPHSLIVLFICCCVLLIFRPKYFKILLFYAFGVFVTFLPLYLVFHDPSVVVNFIKFYPGWLTNKKAGSNQNFILFWLVNWGLVLPTALFSTIKYRLQRNLIVASGWVIFVIANLFIFQPWDWDNTKLFTYAYLFLSLPISLLLSDLLKGAWFKKLFGCIVLVFCTVSGFLDLLSIFNPRDTGHLMWGYDDIAFARDFSRNTLPDSVILVSNNHNNVISNMSGRQILMGYDGWLWSYGVNYFQRKNEIDRFYGCENESKILKEWNINYVVTDPNWTCANTVNANLNLFMQNRNYKIYRVVQRVQGSI